MKKIFLFVAALAATMMAQATVVVDETFNYDAFPGTETGWTQSGTVTTGNGRTLESALTYTNAGGTYVLSGVGKGLKSNYSAGSSYLATKAFTKQQGNGNVVYLSFLYKADGSQTQSNAQIFGMSSSNSGAAVRLWVGKQTDGTGNPFRMGITRASGTGNDVQWSNSTYSVSDVHLIVMKYEFSTETASFYVDPEIEATEPAEPAALDNSMGTAKSSLSYLCFYTTGSSKTNFTISGVRLATTWEEAVAAKAPEEFPDYANSLDGNFGDDIWTNAVNAAPTSGSFPTDTIADWIFTAATVVTSGKTMYFDNDSLEHVIYTARAHMDKNSEGGAIETPFLANIGNLYIVSHSGSDTKNVKIQTRVANGQWEDLESYTNMKIDQLFTIPVNKSNVKIRLLNETTSAQYFYYIGDTNPLSIADTKVVLGTNGWSSYCAPFNFTVTGATAYKVTADYVNNTATLTEVTEAIPAGAGIILNGTEGGKATIKRTASAAALVGNDLLGTTAPTEAPANTLVLGTVEGTTGFYGFSGTTIPAGKAYLSAPVGAPALRIIEEGNTATAIENTEAEQAVKFIENGQLIIIKNGVRYNALGQIVK